MQFVVSVVRKSFSFACFNISFNSFLRRGSPPVISKDAIPSDFNSSRFFLISSKDDSPVSCNLLSCHVGQNSQASLHLYVM